MVFIINPAIVFTIVAGSTTVINNTLKGVGSPVSNKALTKKTTPDTRVPTALTAIAFILLDNSVLSSSLISKYATTVVAILSIRLGTKPKGNLVVIPLKIPVAIPAAIQVLKLFLLRFITRIRVIKEKSICIGRPIAGVT